MSNIFYEQIIYIALVGLGMFVGRFLWRICIFGEAVLVQSDLRFDMFEKTEKLSQRYYKVNKTGAILSYFSNDLETIEESFGFGIVQMIDGVFLLVMSLVKMFKLQGVLTLLLLIPVVGEIFNVILIYNLGKKFGKNGFLTVIFTFILIPIIGLGESSFEGLKITIDDASLERNYKYKRIFFYTILIVGIFSLGLIIYNNLGNNFDKFKVTDNYTYIGNDMRK